MSCFKLRLCVKLGLTDPKDTIDSLLTEDEKQNQKFLRKVKKIKKNQNLQLLAENNEHRTNELISNFRINNCSEFEDDLVKEDEYEVVLEILISI